jgi:hypothetical protein
MNFFRDAAIIALSAGSFAIPASFAQQDAGELEHKVDKVFAAFDKPDSPGCALRHT